MFNKNNFLLLVVWLAIIACGYFAIDYFASEDSNEFAELNEEEIIELEPTFTWRFTEAETNNPDGNPQTNIFLSANTIEKSVDVVDGGCSELEGEKHEGDVSDTGKVQCYYAGLGQYYRIVENESSYAVERKLFEESSPDYSPPESEWEVVVDFAKRY